MENLNNYCDEFWTWNIKDKSCYVYLEGDALKTAHIYTLFLNGTFGVRGTQILNKGAHYWEMNVKASYNIENLMFGIGTKKWPLHVWKSQNGNISHILGNDDKSWGLSFDGLIYHKNVSKKYSKPFNNKWEFTIGILFDGSNLSYFLDGVYLGVAFKDLHLIEDGLYPIVCGFNTITLISLVQTKRSFFKLQELCRTILNRMEVKYLNLPNFIKKYLNESKYSDVLNEEKYSITEEDYKIAEEQNNGEKWIEMFDRDPTTADTRWWGCREEEEKKEIERLKI